MTMTNTDRNIIIKTETFDILQKVKVLILILLLFSCKNCDLIETYEKIKDSKEENNNTKEENQGTNMLKKNGFVDKIKIVNECEEPEKFIKKVLVVSTIDYNRLENVLDRLIVYFKNENIKLEFYIVQEIYQGEKPTNVKYENYIFTSDSGDPQELNRIVTEVSKWGTSFDYNIQTDEFAIDILGYINSKLNLKGLKIEDTLKFRDKVIMKQNLNKDIQKPKLYSFENINNDNVIYPVILKPRCFAGSRGVEIVKNKEDLLKKLEKLKIDYSRASDFDLGEEDVEVEEYINAPICHIDGIVFNNEIRFCICSQYINTCFEYTNGKILGSKKGTEIQQLKALEFANKVNNSLRLPNGVFHLEAFWENDAFTFLEIGMRPGGAEIVPAIELATEINLSNEHVKCQIGLEPTMAKEKYKYFGWLNFPCKLNNDKELHIKSIEFGNKYLETLKIKNIPNIGERGDVYFTNYSKNIGSFVFASNDEKQMENDMKYIIENYKITFE